MVGVKSKKKKHHIKIKRIAGTRGRYGGKEGIWSVASNLLCWERRMSDELVAPDLRKLIYFRLGRLGFILCEAGDFVEIFLHREH